MPEEQTWPLGLCLPTASLAKLMQLQWKIYGTKLDILTDPYRELEDVEEIDKLIRQPPEYHGSG